MLKRAGCASRVVLQQVPEPKHGKNRAHFEIKVADVNEAAARIEELGGRKVRVVEEYRMRTIVAADTEGNEFCLVEHI